MKLEDWLELFRRHREQRVLHFNHLKVLTDMKNPSLRMALKRLTSRKVIPRICRGYYANPFNPPTLDEISAEIYKPSYISLESALYRHGILSQIPYQLTCVTSKLPRRFSTSFGVIQYRQIKKGYFFGFVREKSYLIAEPEKAFVDFLYLNQNEDIKGMLSELNLRALDRSKLKLYAKSLGVKLLKR